MKTKLVRIGNSRGVRLPKPLIEQAGLTEDVELRVSEGEITICSAVGSRRGWEEAAQRLADRDDDTLVDGLTPTRLFAL